MLQTFQLNAFRKSDSAEVYQQFKPFIFLRKSFNNATGLFSYFNSGRFNSVIWFYQVIGATTKS